MKNRILVRGLFIGLLIAVLISPGCGKKGDPIPSQVKLPQRIADLSVESVPEGILLRWSLPGEDPRIDSFRILRSETAAAQACPGCPQDYRPLTMLKVIDDRLGREGKMGFRSVDMTVKADHFYSYRVSACDFRGQCGEPSNPAQRIREKR
jgi:hypothetical protein